MKKALIFASFLALATPALVNQCPTFMNRIDEAMTTAQLDDPQKRRSWTSRARPPMTRAIMLLPKRASTRL